MAFQRKIMDGLAQSRYLLFRAPVDTITTRFMILFLVMLLVVLWLLGMVTTYTLGGWLHILLVIALVVIVYRLVTGRRVV